MKSLPESLALDPKTWLLAISLLGGFFGLAALITRRHRRTFYSGGRVWIFGIFVLAAGNFFLFLRGDVPEILSVFIANGLLHFGISIPNLGSRRFFGSKVSWPDILLLFPAAALTVLFLLRVPLNLNVKERILISSVAVVAIAAGSLLRLPKSGRPRTGRTVLLAAYITAFLFGCIRLVGTLAGGDITGPFSSLAWNLFSFFLSLPMSCLLFLGIVLLLWEEAIISEQNLVREVYHRTKNNLAVLTSLIRLKEDKIGDRADLSDILSHIHTISSLHEQLQQQDSAVNVALRPYVDDILDGVFSDLLNRGLRVEKSIDDIKIPGRDAVNIGLLINELAVNARKHAFYTVEGSLFAITAVRDAARKSLVLKVSNTGAPFPEDITLENSTSTGLQLVTAFVNHYNGSISLRKSPRTEFEIVLPLPEWQ